MRRVFSWRNLVCLVVVPLLVWLADLLAHMVPNAWLGNVGAIVFLSLLLPIAAFLVIRWMYLSLWNGEMLPPEVAGIIGFLYAQPTYMVALKLLLEPQDPVKLAHWAVLTAIVPLSTLMISTYDGTLIGVPLAVLTMIVAGYYFRRRGARK